MKRELLVEIKLGKCAEFNGAAYIMLLEMDPNTHKYVLHYFHLFLYVWNTILNSQKLIQQDKRIAGDLSIAFQFAFNTQLYWGFNNILKTV